MSHFFSAAPPVQVFLRPYTRAQLGTILQQELDKIPNEDKENDVLKRNFSDLVLAVFQPVCKSWPQFKRAADLVWPEYIKPVNEAHVEPDNARSLYRYRQSVTS